MKRYTKDLISCEDCPHIKFYTGNHAHCMLNIISKELPAATILPGELKVLHREIPEWCDLPDVPERTSVERFREYREIKHLRSLLARWVKAYKTYSILAQAEGKGYHKQGNPYENPGKLIGDTRDAIVEG